MKKNVACNKKCINFAAEKSSLKKLSLGGGIGRRVGLKNRWGNTRAGSIPALGTDLKTQSLENQRFSRDFLLAVGPWWGRYDNSKWIKMKDKGLFWQVAKGSQKTREQKRCKCWSTCTKTQNLAKLLPSISFCKITTFLDISVIFLFTCYSSSSLMRMLWKSMHLLETWPRALS